MLNVLVKDYQDNPLFDINFKDKKNRTVLDLAYLQDSERMERAIKRLGGRAGKTTIMARGGTSIISQ